MEQPQLDPEILAVAKRTTLALCRGVLVGAVSPEMTDLIAASMSSSGNSEEITQHIESALSGILQGYDSVVRELADALEVYEPGCSVAIVDRLIRDAS